MQLVIFSFALLCGLCSQFAWASSDDFCGPHWNIVTYREIRCTNLPILNPNNNTQVNLQLLLVDKGFASVKDKPLSKDNIEAGYGKVPFNVQTFNNNIDSLLKTSLKTASKGNYGDGEGSRCASNDSGALDFIAALNASRDIPDAERIELIRRRQSIKPTCTDVPTNATASVLIQSPRGKEFLVYLAGATDFYDGHFENALDCFTRLSSSTQPWLKETALYMLGRIQLNSAQKNAFDEYGDLQIEKAAPPALQASELAFRSYLQSYPSGRYAASARGLLRRVYWYSNQPQKLADEFDWQLAHPGSPQNNLSLSKFVEEVDLKLVSSTDPSQIKSPLLLATIDLAKMRKPTSSSAPPPITLDDLQKQQPLFADYPELYDYLLAAHLFYLEGDHARVLKIIPDVIPNHALSYLDLSRLTLRGLALEAMKDHDGARKLWLSLMPLSKAPLQKDLVALALAIHYEYNGGLDLIFAKGSPIQDAAIREILIGNAAGPDLLHQLIARTDNTIQERHLALYVLLKKDLYHGFYQNYLNDLALLPHDSAKYTQNLENAYGYGKEPPFALFSWVGNKPDDNYSCPSVTEIAKTLSINKNDPNGLICLGEFDRLNDTFGLGLESDLTANNDHSTLGQAPTQFPGTLFTRGNGYQTIIADPSASPRDKAYALYRAINCYATTGDNHCGDKGVEKKTRRAWFLELKAKYPETTWAKSQKYYW